MPSPLAPGLTRRLVLKAAGGLVLATGCGKELSLLVNFEPPYPLDTDGDDEMTAPATVFNKLYDPLLLYARSVIAPGGAAGPNTAALMNPHGTPMEVLEVRWRIFPNNTAENMFARLTGMGIGVKMDLGDIPVVDADVPIDSFGTSRDSADYATNATAIMVDPSDDDSVLANPYSYRWRLKFPLLVPAGCVLTPLYTHLGQNHFPATVDTIYVCRTLPANYTMPQNIKVPWAGSYNSIAFDNLADQPAGKDFSSELDIVNPFQQPLELARLTGHCSAVLNGDLPAGSTPPTSIETGLPHRFQLGKVRTRSRSGDEIVRSKTPFNGLFPFGWRVWDIPGGWTMRPGEFYKVQLTVDATDPADPIPTQMGSIQYAMAAIGYRALPQGVFTVAAAGGTP